MSEMESMRLLDGRIENIENILFHGSFAQLRLSARQIRTNQLTAVQIATGTTVPYAKMDANGVLIVNGLAGSAALRLENDPTDTITEIRECEAGLAVSSDETDVVKFELRDTAFGTGATNLRFNLAFTSLEGRLEIYDSSDTIICRIKVTNSTGAVEVESLGAGDLTLRSATGQVVIDDDVEPSTNNQNYLGDYQKAWKGIILADQTDSKYYWVHLDSGAWDIDEVTS